MEELLAMQQERMAGIRDQAVALLNEVKMTGETSTKADLLKTLMELVLHRDPSTLLPEFVPYLMELQTEHGSPIRKYLAECVSLSTCFFLTRLICFWCTAVALHCARSKLRNWSLFFLFSV